MATKAKTKSDRVRDEDDGVGGERMEQRAEAKPGVRDDIIRNRAGEPVFLQASGDTDIFAFDRSIIPNGWDYKWLRIETLGMPDMQNQVEAAGRGWESVPADRHDGMFMSKGYVGAIERRGMRLVERDMRLTKQAQADEKRRAQAQLFQSRALAGMMPSSQIADFNHGEAQRVSGVKIERSPTLPDRKYSYSVDE